MNLRDKLRNAPEGSTPAVEEQASAPRPKAAQRKPEAEKKSLASQLPKLDVNRRFLMIAGAAALVASLTAVMYLNNAGSGLEEGGTKIKVISPKDDVAIGQQLTEDVLTTVEIPKAYLPKGYITELDKLKDKVAIAPMVAGEAIIEARVSAPDSKYGIAYLLKKGERAKTIKVDSASGIGGLLKPGNEVDLIATIPDPNNDGRRIGVPVVQKARAIAVGNHLMGEVPKGEEDKNDGGGISSESTVTLALPGGKVGMITLLEDLGNLKMVLRANGDTQIVRTAFSDEDIMSLVSGKMPPKPVAIKPATPAPVHHDPPPPVATVHTVITHHEAPVYHAPPPKPPVHHDPPPKPVPVAPKPVPVAPPVHHDPPPVTTTGHGPEIIRFGGGGN